MFTEVTPHVKLIRHTYDPQELVAMAAKLCYSSSDLNTLQEKISQKDQSAFIRKLVDMGHESPTEHVSFTFGIEGVSRSFLAQITRHRVASFCVSGDTVIGYTERTKGRTIRELYEKPEQYQHMSSVRSVDPATFEISNRNVKNVFYNGVQTTYELKTQDGYCVRATANHRFLTNNGWKELGNLRVGDIVYTNGVPAYKSKDWLKHQYHDLDLSQAEIGELCGVSKHTIRSWVRKFVLQKPMGSWTIGKPPANKGRTKNDYAPMMQASIKMTGRKGHPSAIKQDYKYITTHQAGTRQAGYVRVMKYYPKTNKCSYCGEEGYTEIHHINKDPRDNRPENTIELCTTCHKRQHLGAAVLAVKPSKITSITYYGEEDVYDLEVDDINHNYVANGFAVHNCVQSQRYVGQKRDEGCFNYIIPPAISALGTDARAKYAAQMGMMQDWYNEWVDALGNAGESSNEDARFVLPNAAETRMLVTMNARELKHFFSLRCCNRAQWEIRAVAWEMLRQCQEVAPELFADAGPFCVRGACSEGGKSCGNPYTRV